MDHVVVTTNQAGRRQIDEAPDGLQQPVVDAAPAAARGILLRCGGTAERADGVSMPSASVPRR